MILSWEYQSEFPTERAWEVSWFDIGNEHLGYMERKRKPVE